MMAMYPNGRHMSRSPGRHLGVAPGLDVYFRGRNDRFNQHVGQDRAKTASTPDGYGMAAVVPPKRAGSMSALTPFAEGTFTGALLQGGPMEATGSISWTSDDASLGLVVNMDGTATLTITGNDSSLRLVIGMDGTGSITVTGAGGLSMIVPFEGSGSFALTGNGDLRGRLDMDGSWTPFSELSPEGLAAAVWQAVATTNNEPGTMGAKLNTASSGGVDLNALAQAVWAYATRTLTSSGASGMTPEQAAQLAEIWRIHGLDSNGPLVVTPTSRTAGDVEQTVNTAGATTTVTRQ